MSFLKRLFRVQIVAHIALAAILVVTAIVWVAAVAIWHFSSFALGDKSALLSARETLAGLLTIPLFGYLGGAPTVIVYGAPAYALAAWKGLSSWPIVILIGAFPGIVLAAITILTSQPANSIEGTTTIIALSGGVLTACGTHLACRRRGASFGVA